MTMKRVVSTLFVVMVLAGSAQAHGLVIPNDKNVPPLAMLNHRVAVTVEDQVAITKVEQTFRNHTQRPLEATYVFPVPRGASVRDFAMWVDGKKVKGELLEAPKAKQIYTDIVRRTYDPGLLEYIGADLLRMQIFPVPPQGDTKIELSYTSIAKRDQDVVEYTYPLKTDGKATATLEDFSMKITLKSQQPIVNIYSPTHAVTINRTNDKEASVGFDKNQALLDKDFQLFYTTGNKDVGLTALQHRPIASEDGYFMLLISPRVEVSKSQQIPRDMVFVLDTSGSMREDDKIGQAKKALKYCLDGLTEQDRFAMMNFATTVNRYRDNLTPVNKDQIAEAKKWVDRLEPTGGTAINDALLSALEMRTSDEGRTFTICFFTDGKPTIGETNTDKILANIGRKNTANTRIFSFGVGYDMNAVFMDQLSEHTRGASSFVRPGEDIEVKVSSFYDKISHPVLANLKLSPVGQGVSLSEVYPPQLPDLFHGQQVIVMGRYHGEGPTALKLTGTVGTTQHEYVYETDFKPKTEDKGFVEELWGRRKVGYLLEQIRLNGDKKELVEEVTKLAKKYGIATPYTSYLVVPDAPMPVAGRRGAGPGGPGFAGNGTQRGGGGLGMPGGGAPAGLAPSAPGQEFKKVAEFAKENQRREGELAEKRDKSLDENLSKAIAGKPESSQGWQDGAARAALEGKNQKDSYDLARQALRDRNIRSLQVDKLGVDLSCQVNDLKGQSRLQQTALRSVGNRNCLELGGVWIDEGFNDKTKLVTVKAMSDAYFKMLERQPILKEVFKLGNHLVWITPSGTALVIDTTDGKEQLSDEEIDRLFVVAGK
jgi:Ca-activated chloride channel family protein